MAKWKIKSKSKMKERRKKERKKWRRKGQRFFQESGIVYFLFPVVVGVFFDFFSRKTESLTCACTKGGRVLNCTPSKPFSVAITSKSAVWLEGEPVKRWV